MTKQEKTALIASGVNLTLTIVKFFLAFLTGSVALLAEAYHSFGDILTSLSVFFALRLDKKGRKALEDLSKKSESPPTSVKKIRVFRLMGWDSKAAAGIGIMLVFVAIGIFLRVMFFEPVSLNYPLFATIVLIISSLLSYIVYRIEISVGNETGSQALVADGQHARSDFFVTILVVATLLGDRAGFRFDRSAALVIALFIAINGISIVKKALNCYFALVRGESVGEEVVLEDNLVIFVGKLFSIVKKFGEKTVCFVPGLGGSIEKAGKRVFVTAIILSIFSYLLSGVFTVSVSEQAIIERFGKPVSNGRIFQPGIHFSFPWPVDKVKKLDTETIRRMALGYTGVRQDEDFILWTNVHYIEEHPFLTGENSFLDSAVNIHYRISNMFDFVYQTAEPVKMLEKLSYNRLQELFGQRDFFTTVTTHRDELEQTLQKGLQAIIDKHKLGIEIVNVCFRDLHPPAKIASVYEDVVSAQEDYETSIENARGYSLDLLPRARAEAQSLVMNGEAYKEKMVLESEGKAFAFDEQRKVYEKYPIITEKRMLLQALEKSLPPVDKFIVNKKRGRSSSLWFSLSPEKSFLNNWSFPPGENK